jgi:hypothetical protein
MLEKFLDQHERRVLVAEDVSTALDEVARLTGSRLTLIVEGDRDLLASMQRQAVDAILERNDSSVEEIARLRPLTSGISTISAPPLDSSSAGASYDLTL